MRWKSSAHPARHAPSCLSAHTGCSRPAGLPSRSTTAASRPRRWTGTATRRTPSPAPRTSARIHPHRRRGPQAGPSPPSRPTAPLSRCRYSQKTSSAHGGASEKRSSPPRCLTPVAAQRNHPTPPPGTRRSSSANRGKTCTYPSPNLRKSCTPSASRLCAA